MLLVVFYLMTSTLFSKNKVVTIHYLDSTSAIIYSEKIALNDKKPNPIFQLFKKKQRLNKRITAAVLAFPFPFGIVGLHRIYLGTKPHVPVVYIASFGGIFGLLPFIDFCAITFGKNFDQYRDNGNVFMWVQE